MRSIIALFVIFSCVELCFGQQITPAAPNQPAEPSVKKVTSTRKSSSVRRGTNLGPTNIVRLSAPGLVNKLKLHYEKIVSTRSAFGITGAVYYSNSDAGSFKIEPHYKYYFSATAPTGTYIVGGPNIYVLNNFKFRYTAGEEQQSVILANQPFFNARTKDQLITTIQSASFTRVGGCVGFGYQFVFGQSNNFVFDVAMGYQYLPLPASVKEPITRSFTAQSGDRIYEYDINYKYSERRNFYGLASPVFSRLSVGFLF